MFVISQLNFGDYLNEPCYSAAASLLPRPIDLKSQHKHRGDFDVLLLHRRYGVLVGEVKSIGDQFSTLFPSARLQDQKVAREGEAGHQTVEQSRRGLVVPAVGPAASAQDCEVPHDAQRLLCSVTAHAGQQSEAEAGMCDTALRQSPKYIICFLTCASVKNVIIVRIINFCYSQVIPPPLPVIVVPAVPSVENTKLKGSSCKAWSKSVYIHVCYAYCQGFLPC